MREPAARGASIDITELERRLRRQQPAKASERDLLKKLERLRYENERAAPVDRYDETVAKEATLRTPSARRAARRESSYHHERFAFEAELRGSFDHAAAAAAPVQQRRHKAVYQQEVVHRNRKTDWSGAKSEREDGRRFPKFRHAVAGIAVLGVAAIGWAFTHRSGGSIASQEIATIEPKKVKTVSAQPVDGVIDNNSALGAVTEPAPPLDRKAALLMNGAPANASAKPATALRSARFEKVAATEAPSSEDNATAPAVRRVATGSSAVQSEATYSEADVRGVMYNGANAQSAPSLDRSAGRPILPDSSFRDDRRALSSPSFISAEQACDLAPDHTNETRRKCIYEQQKYIGFASENWARLSPQLQSECNARAKQDHFGEHNEILARCVEKALLRS